MRNGPASPVPQGEHALSLHRDEEALDAAAHAVQLNPDDASGHLRLGELYRARNNTASAVASLRRALARGAS